MKGSTRRTSAQSAALKRVDEPQAVPYGYGMFELRWKTPSEWAQVALSDLDAFLLDHAACERKASAVGMSFVVRYPDRLEMVEPMIQFAREELEHFHQVYRVIHERGLVLTKDEPDPYVTRQMERVRTGREERLLDRLLVSAIIEARGTERMEMICAQVEDPSLQGLYLRLARSEKRHKNFFIEMAQLYFSQETIDARMDALLDIEAEIAKSLPFRNALH